jgi:uncharacterized protein YndB with AHSA1/START domain
MADIRHAISVAATPEQLYELVSSGKGFARWWAADVTEQAGGIVELGFFQRATVYRLQSVRLAAPAEALWICQSGKEWQGTRIEFSLQGVGANTMVHFLHAGWAAGTDYFIACNTTWGELMFRLKAAAEGKAPGPLFLKDSLAY